MDKMFIDEEFNDELKQKVEEEIEGVLISFRQDLENIADKNVREIYNDSYSEEELEQIKNHFKELLSEEIKENL